MTKFNKLLGSREINQLVAMFARVAIDVPLNKLFDYRANHNVVPGSLVVVPFGRGRKTGLVMQVSTESDVADEQLRDVESVVPGIRPLPDFLLKLIEFCSEYYHYPIGQIAMSVMPNFSRAAWPVPAFHRFEGSVTYVPGASTVTGRPASCASSAARRTSAPRSTLRRSGSSVTRPASPPSARSMCASRSMRADARISSTMPWSRNA